MKKRTFILAGVVFHSLGGLCLGEMAELNRSALVQKIAEFRVRTDALDRAAFRLFPERHLGYILFEPRIAFEEFPERCQAPWKDNPLLDEAFRDFIHRQVHALKSKLDLERQSVGAADLLGEISRALEEQVRFHSRLSCARQESDQARYCRITIESRLASHPPLPEAGYLIRDALSLLYTMNERLYSQCVLLQPERPIPVGYVVQYFHNRFALTALKILAENKPESLRACLGVIAEREKDVDEKVERLEKARASLAGYLDGELRTLKSTSDPGRGLPKEDLRKLDTLVQSGEEREQALSYAQQTSVLRHEKKRLHEQSCLLQALLGSPVADLH